MEIKKETRGRKRLKPADFQDQICGALRMGTYIETAVIISGLSKTTFKDWMSRGAKDLIGPYNAFYDAVQMAIAKGEASHVQNIKEQSKLDWRASSWFLERRHHSKWQRKEVQRFDIANAEDKPFKVETDLSDSELEARAAKLRAELGQSETNKG